VACSDRYVLLLLIHLLLPAWVMLLTPALLPLQGQLLRRHETLLPCAAHPRSCLGVVRCQSTSQCCAAAGLDGMHREKACMVLLDLGGGSGSGIPLWDWKTTQQSVRSLVQAEGKGLLLKNARCSVQAMKTGSWPCTADAFNSLFKFMLGCSFVVSLPKTRPPTRHSQPLDLSQGERSVGACQPVSGATHSSCIAPWQRRWA
jgi:hypothetical protein